MFGSKQSQTCRIRDAERAGRVVVQAASRIRGLVAAVCVGLAGTALPAWVRLEGKLHCNYGPPQGENVKCRSGGRNLRS